MNKPTYVPEPIPNKLRIKVNKALVWGWSSITPKAEARFLVYQSVYHLYGKGLIAQVLTHILRVQNPHATIRALYTCVLRPVEALLDITTGPATVAHSSLKHSLREERGSLCKSDTVAPL